MPFDKNTLYLIGDAQSSVNNPITQQYSAFFIGARSVQNFRISSKV